MRRSRMWGRWLVVMVVVGFGGSPAWAMDENVSFRNSKAGIDLGGTITRPDTGEPKAAIILLTGSGAQDRDETIFGHKPFKTLAEYLSGRGYLVLRYDDRGVGQSGGSPDGTTMDFADDAEAALDFVMTRSAGSFGFIGHSEGGTIGAIVAARRRDVRFLVMLAGPALPGDRVLRQQIAAQQTIAGASAEYVARNDKNAERIISAALTSGEGLARELELVRMEVGESNAWASAQLAFFGSTWMRHFFAFDPAATLTDLTIPVLALYGEKDRQVLAETNRLSAEKALARNAGARVQLIAGANHLFQMAQTGHPAEYASIKEDISPEVLKLVADWLDQRP
jgi:uncharacterized protein